MPAILVDGANVLRYGEYVVAIVVDVVGIVGVVVGVVVVEIYLSN